MRQRGSIAGFGDVAMPASDQSANTTADANIDVNIDASANANTAAFVDQISDRRKSSILMGLYIKDDIAKVLNQLAKKAGTGGKSKVVNEALRKVFTEIGLM